MSNHWLSSGNVFTPQAAAPPHGPAGVKTPNGPEAGGGTVTPAAPVTDRRDIPAVAALFSMLAEPTRLTILSLLARGERSVSSLCRELALPQPSVSHHLAKLRAAGLVHCRRKGRLMFYGLSDLAAVVGDGDLTVPLDGLWVRICT